MPSCSQGSSGFVVRAFLACVVLVPLAGCIFARNAVIQLPVDTLRSDSSRQLESPAKVHLKDGSVVVFPKGFAFDGEVIRGAGEQHDLLRTSRTAVDAVPIECIAAVEYYTAEVSSRPTIAGTVLYVAVLGVLAFMAYMGAVGSLAGGL